MKKASFTLIIIVSYLIIVCSGCHTLHEMAEASLDDNHLDYSGLSPHPPPLGTPYVNLCYLWFEDLLDYFFPGVTDYFAGSPSVLQPDLAYRPGPYYAYPGLLLDTGHTITRHFDITLSEGLEYVGKGGRESDNGTTTITRLNYLEVPVLINYNHALSQGKEILHAGLGPYAAVGLFGESKSQGQSAALKFGKNGDFDRMDYGLQLKAGCFFAKKWDLSVGYDWGMKNLLGNSADGDKAKTKSLSLNIGYQIK